MSRRNTELGQYRGWGGAGNAPERWRVRRKPPAISQRPVNDPRPIRVHPVRNTPRFIDVSVRPQSESFRGRSRGQKKTARKQKVETERRRSAPREGYRRSSAQRRRVQKQRNERGWALTETVTRDQPRDRGRARTRDDGAGIPAVFQPVQHTGTSQSGESGSPFWLWSGKGTAGGQEAQTRWQTWWHTSEAIASARRVPIRWAILAPVDHRSQAATGRDKGGAPFYLRPTAHQQDTAQQAGSRDSGPTGPFWARGGRQRQLTKKYGKAKWALGEPVEHIVRVAASPRLSTSPVDVAFWLQARPAPPAVQQSRPAGAFWLRQWQAQLRRTQRAQQAAETTQERAKLQEIQWIGGKPVKREGSTDQSPLPFWVVRRRERTDLLSPAVEKIDKLGPGATITVDLIPNPWLALVAQQMHTAKSLVESPRTGDVPAWQDASGSGLYTRPLHFHAPPAHGTKDRSSWKAREDPATIAGTSPNAPSDFRNQRLERSLTSGDAETRGAVSPHDPLRGRPDEAPPLAASLGETRGNVGSQRTSASAPGLVLGGEREAVQARTGDAGGRGRDQQLETSPMSGRPAEHVRAGGSGHGGPPDDPPGRPAGFPEDEGNERRSRKKPLILRKEHERMLFDLLRRGETSPAELAQSPEFLATINQIPEADNERARWLEKWNTILEGSTVLEVIIRWNRGLVMDIANSYKSYVTRTKSTGENVEAEGQLSFDDIVEGGYEGLMNAIRKFEPESGNSFSAIAFPLILGSAQKAIREHLGLSQRVLITEGQARQIEAAVYGSEGRQTNEQELRNLLYAISDASGPVIENVLQMLYPQDISYVDATSEGGRTDETVAAAPETPVDPTVIVKNARRGIIRSLVAGKTEAELAEEAGLDIEQIRTTVESIREEIRKDALPHPADIFRRTPVFDPSQSHEENIRRLMDERFTDTEIARVVAYSPEGVHSMRKRYESETGRKTRPITAKLKKAASITLIEAGLTNEEIREITGYSDAAILLHRREREGIDEQERRRKREEMHTRINMLIQYGLSDRAISKLTRYSIEGIMYRRSRLEDQLGEKQVTTARRRIEEIDRQARYDKSQSRHKNMIRLILENCSTDRINELTHYPSETIYHNRSLLRREGRLNEPEQITSTTAPTKTVAQERRETRERTIVRGLIQQGYSDGEIMFLTFYTRGRVQYQRRLLFKETGDVITPWNLRSATPQQAQTQTAPTRSQLREEAIATLGPELVERIRRYIDEHPPTLAGKRRKQREPDQATLAFDAQVAELSNPPYDYTAKQIQQYFEDMGLDVPSKMRVHRSRKRTQKRMNQTGNGE